MIVGQGRHQLSFGVPAQAPVAAGLTKSLLAEQVGALALAEPVGVRSGALPAAGMIWALVAFAGQA